MGWTAYLLIAYKKHADATDYIICGVQTITQAASAASEDCSQRTKVPFVSQCPRAGPRVLGPISVCHRAAGMRLGSFFRGSSSWHAMAPCQRMCLAPPPPVASSATAGGAPAPVGGAAAPGSPAVGCRSASCSSQAAVCGTTCSISCSAAGRQPHPKRRSIGDAHSSQRAHKHLAAFFIDSALDQDAKALLGSVCVVQMLCRALVGYLPSQHPLYWHYYERKSSCASAIYPILLKCCHGFTGHLARSTGRI